MTENDLPDDRAWDSGWDEHARAQQHRLAKLSLAEKLQWLEEAQRLAGQLARSRESMPSDAGAEEPATRYPAAAPHPTGFWNERYAEPGYAYGTEPNDFVREQAAAIPPGRVLCLGEGQGRNAVFLAGLGFDVTALDQSAVGLERATALASERGVRVTTLAADLAEYTFAPGAWQAIVSVFIHLPSALRREVHRQVVAGLAPGGVFVFEAYAPRQLEFGTGGPDDPDRLAPLATLVEELAGLEFEVAREIERDVIEGRYHTGRAITVQIAARRRP